MGGKATMNIEEPDYLPARKVPFIQGTDLKRWTWQNGSSVIVLGYANGRPWQNYDAQTQFIFACIDRVYIELGQKWRARRSWWDITMISIPDMPLNKIDFGSKRSVRSGYRWSWKCNVITSRQLKPCIIPIPFMQWTSRPLWTLWMNISWHRAIVLPQRIWIFKYLWRFVQFLQLQQFGQLEQQYSGQPVTVDSGQHPAGQPVSKWPADPVEWRGRLYSTVSDMIKMETHFTVWMKTAINLRLWRGWKRSLYLPAGTGRGRKRGRILQAIR